MADFSFVDEGIKRKESGSSAGQAAAAPGASPRIAIPSFQEVQRSEQRPAALNLFRPSSQGPSAVPSSSGLQQQQQPQVGADAFAFLESAPGLRPRSGGGPGGAPPTFQQQQQQQQWRPPASGPPPSFQAAGLSRPGFVPAGPAGPRPLPAAPYPPAHPSSQAAAGAYQPPPVRPLHGQQPLPPPPQQQQQQQQHRPSQTQPQTFGPPQPPPQQPAGNAFPANAIIVNRRQEGNPVLKHIRNVRWQFGDIVPDYMLGKDAAALFISLRYHLLKPDYIHQRIRELQRSFRLRLILCHVDTEDAVEPLAQVTRAAIGNDCTLICAWSNQECARYLETFKSYENKPAEVIQKDVGSDYLSRINAALTTVRGVNKTDVKTLGDRFGSVASIFKASAEELQRCPGIGPTKAKRLADTFHEPFRKNIVSGGAAARPPPQQAGPGTQQQQQQQQQQVLVQQQQQQEAGMEQHQQQQEQQIPSQGGTDGGGALGQVGSRQGPERAALEAGPGGQGSSVSGNGGSSGGGAVFDYDLDDDDEEDWDI